MIALEIQGLSERRENLLTEIGRAVVASGFTLQRQRLADDHHGVLLTMIVRGPARKQRALSNALDAHERLISFVISDYEEDVQKPHFAAETKLVAGAYVPSPMPIIAPPSQVRAVPFGRTNDIHELVPQRIFTPGPEPEIELKADAMLASVSVPVRVPTPVPAPESLDQFVELILLGPDLAAVNKLLPKLTNHYPDIFPKLLTLKKSVVEGARESSLLLAGQRMGAWVFKRDYVESTALTLHDALEGVGYPALCAIVEVEQRGEQLHILNSPGCLEGGESSCQFFSGYLEGLLRPAMSSDSVSIFSVCCRSYGAGECILAISDG